MPFRPRRERRCHHRRRRCRHPQTFAASAAVPLLQDLAKTNRVFVAPTDPTAALPFVQLNDL
jgi:hypothetical protein